MEQNYVISIGRSIGAGGLSTAKALSEELGIKMYDKELITEVARRSGLSPDIFEKKDERASRSKMTSLFGFRSLLQGNGSITTDSILNEESLFKIQSQVIRDLAERIVHHSRTLRRLYPEGQSPLREFLHQCRSRPARQAPYGARNG